MKQCPFQNRECIKRQCMAWYRYQDDAGDWQGGCVLCWAPSRSIDPEV